MRFIITAQSDAARPATGQPERFDADLFKAYMRFNEEMHQAGVLVASEGLNPSARGARIAVADGRRYVVDGPFAESKELVGGFYLIEVASLEEAIGWALRAPSGMGTDDILEVRQLTGPDDLPADLLRLIEEAAPTWSAAVWARRAPPPRSGSVKTLTFETTIRAPRRAVWATMLGPEGYQAWTAAFCEGSHYVGSWDEGARIRFLAPSGDGMVSVIAEHRPEEFVSIRHLGMIEKGVEDTTSEKVRSWAPAYENYRFTDGPEGGCTVTVTLDTAADWEAYMLDTYPKALALLKGLCERPA